MRKRILHCAYSGLGGHAAVLFALLSEDLRRQFDHFVLFFGVEDLREEYARSCRQLDIPFRFVRKRGRLALRSHREVMRIIREVSPDLVMVNGTPLAIPILGSRTLGRNGWSVVVRETQANHLKTVQEWVGSYVAARSADAVVYLTDEYRTEVEDRLVLPLRRRGLARVIPNGVEVEDRQPRVRRSATEVRLVMVSRVVPIKDHPTLIEAVRILAHERGYRGLRLFIAGEGPSLSALREFAATAGVESQVEFTGLLDRAAVHALLTSADIYVHCTFGETMSNSILEAMAGGLPVVASDVRGVSNLILDGVDGILVPVQDAAALATALEVLIRDPRRRHALGTAAHARIVRDLSRQRMVSDYSELFERLAASTTRVGTPAS
jgi:L-malate glycosyltransferase